MSAEMSLASLCRQAAAKPSVRDLMARLTVAEQQCRVSTDGTFAADDEAYLDARDGLIASLMDATGLTRREVLDLGAHLI